MDGLADYINDQIKVNRPVKSQYCNSNYSPRFHNGSKVQHKGVPINSVPHLLIAQVILASTPMYSVNNESFVRTKHKGNKATSHLFDISNTDWNEDHHASVPRHSESNSRSDYTCFHVIEDDEDDESEVDLLAHPAVRKVNTHRGVPKLQFDTDSFAIGIDTYASFCMSPELGDFIPESLQQLSEVKRVQPYGKEGPTIQVKMKGTIKWNIEDNDGRTHEFTIPNSLYVPDGNMRLLSPQHWAATRIRANYTKREKDLTHSVQHWDRNVLRWGRHGQYAKTIYNNKRSRVPTMYSAAGTSGFNEYHSIVQHHTNTAYMTCMTCCEANVISDDEEEPQNPAPRTVGTAAPREPPTDEPNSQAPSPSPSDTPTPTVDNIEPTVIEEVNDIFQEQQLQPVHISEEEEETVQATTDKGEFMRWHLRLGHLPFKKLIRLAEQGIIPRKLRNVRPPKCSSCIYGRMHRRAKRHKGAQNGVREATKPGQCVSVDQMESSSVGFIGQMKGRLTTRRYKYATVFVDHYSRYTYVYLQSSIDSEETAQAKSAFEAHARSMGVQILSYHADNGRFADNAFLHSVREGFQTITFCGVNAHWQNGIAERMIRTLRESARTQLLHCIAHWPSAVTTHLWPYALSYSAVLHNQLPNAKGETPLNLFSGVSVQPNPIHHHTFGCPVYALDNNLQGGNHIKHWQPRARLGIYLGPSPRHARTVSLVLNPHTGTVSPQFHVQHDEFFETVKELKGEPKSPWITLAGFKKATPIPRSTPSGIPRNSPSGIPTRPSITREPSVMEMEPDLPPHQVLHQEVEPQPEETREPRTEPSEEEPQQPSYSRSGRRRIPSTRLLESEQGGTFDYSAFKASYDDEEEYYYSLHQDDYAIQDQMLNPIAFKASGDPDTMYYHQAIREADKDDFLKAIVKEVNDHIEGNHWELVPRESLPKGAKVLDSVWSMKRKRDIKTRQVYKHKARLNIHGGQQVYGIHYTDTFSPVVSWFSVRLLMIIAKLNGYHTRQIDFVLAYPQADLPFENYMNLPHGIKTKDGDGNSHVLKLRKNIYGGRNSGRIWNDYLKVGLINIGFKQSQVDECVFYRGDVIFFFYVDDGIFIGKSEEGIEKALADLQNRKKTKNKFTIDDQGDIADYLGINFDEDNDGKLKLWQPHLIDQIIEEVGIKDKEKAHSTPAASTKPLSRLKDEPEVQCEFDYRRAIGKLNYLEKSSRPDIAYAVHQCARFCSNPKAQHIKAVKHLVRYLKGTREQGMFLHPDPSKSFEVWVDADFSGNYNKITSTSDPSTAKSRSGYVITYAGCPIMWVSKLQTQIALSTCEAEYISLSQAIRDTTPMMNLLQELKDYGFEENYVKPTINCTVFEDNTGALALATIPKIRPRTKHINLVYHHFREMVRDGIISVKHVDTKDQIGDMFTKPLPQNSFIKFRKLLLGW